MSSSFQVRSEQDRKSHWRFTLLLLGWALAMGLAAMVLDERVSAWVAGNVPVEQLMPLFKLMKMPGHFAFTMLVAAVVTIKHPLRWRAGAFVCLSGMLSGLLCALLKWGVGRTRPFHGVAAFDLRPFAKGLHGLFGVPNQSFPSGHTCLAFAAAAAISMILPRWRAGAFALALIVASERVLQNSHYVGDVVAAAGLGVLSAWIMWTISSGLLELRPKRHSHVLGGT